MDLINEAEIRDTWSPIIESATGINNSEKLAWMSTYCHNHKLYEDANIMSLTPMNLMGMGAASVGAVGTGTGSGDKAPSLLPLAMQVAAQTIALDLVPVVPMAGPMGLLSYLDFTYQGGSLDTKAAPTYVKITNTFESGKTAADFAAITVKDNGASPAVTTSTSYTFVALSRLDGKAIYSVDGDVVAANVAADLDAAVVADAVIAAVSSVELVKGLEDHIAGFAGNANGDPYSRELGESTPDKLMGLTLYSKTVAAETFQAAAAVTREQVQDLKQFGVDAIAQVESVLTNELTQSINALILKKLRAHGLANSGTTLDVTLTAAASYVGGQTIASEHRRILTGILAAANYIANKGRRGAGNFAVVSARVASAIQSVSGFVPNPMSNTVSQVAGGIYPLGSVAGVNIYTDPNLAWGSGDNDVLVGRKGDGNGAGVVFMPYLMAESVQTIAEGTMAPKVAVKSRFALVDAGHHPETAYATFALTNFVL